MLPLVAEQVVHGIRPVDPAAGDVPVPQAAAAAAQRRVEAAADLLATSSARARLPGLQAVGEADAEMTRLAAATGRSGRAGAARQSASSGSTGWSTAICPAAGRLRTVASTLSPSASAIA